MRIFSVIIIVLLLVGCQPSEASVQKSWSETREELVIIINDIEALKSELQTSWDEDVKHPEGNRHLGDSDSLVQRNLARREELITKARSKADELLKLNSDLLTETQRSQRDELHHYINSSLEGLAIEHNFFARIAGGSFPLDDLDQMAESIEVVREEQQASLTVEPETTEPDVTTQPRYRLNQATQLFEPIGDNPAKAVLLTFDDVPLTGDAQHSLKIAQELKALEVPAVFFVYGAYLNSEIGRQTVKAIHDLGFPLGNHSQNHPDLTTLSPDDIRLEMTLVNDQLLEITGEKPRYFRPPYGATNATVAAIAREEGMIPMNWTYGYDWEGDYQTPTALSDVMVNTALLTPGANLLMHDRNNTAEAIASIVRGLQAKGYTFIVPQEISDEAD